MIANRSSGGKRVGVADISSNHMQGVCKRQPVYVNIRAQGRFVHKDSDCIVGQEDAHELLLYHLRRIASQYAVTGAQDSLKFLGSTFPIPALGVESRNVVS